MNFPPIYRGSLIPETAPTLIERELARFLALAFGVRQGQPGGGATTRDLAALRQFRRTAITDFALRFVDAVGKTYRWDEYESRPDDGAAVIAPADAKGAGRWVREGASEAQRTTRHQGIRDAALRLDRWSLQRTGFAQVVRIWEGEYDDEAIAEIFAKKPAYVVVPAGSSRTARSLVPGTYYQETYRFRVWGISQSLRRGPAGLFGSAYALDGGDPGLNYVMGSIKRALAGSTLGVPGVITTEIGDEDVVAHDLSNRVFCNSLELNVHTTLHLPDDDIVPLTAVTTTTQLADPGDAEQVDLQNYVADGCYPDRFGPRITTIRGGIAYVAGQLVQAQPQSLTLPVGSDCYRDLLPSGVFVVQSVPTGKPAPAAPAGSLRVGVTTTDLSSITSDRFLCSTLISFVGPDRVPKDS